MPGPLAGTRVVELQGRGPAGEHTTEVLRECGFGDGEVDALLAAAVVRQAERAPR